MDGYNKMFGVSGHITNSHKEIIDGKEITVIDDFKLTGVSAVPMRQQKLSLKEKLARYPHFRALMESYWCYVDRHGEASNE